MTSGPSDSIGPIAQVEDWFQQDHDQLCNVYKDYIWDPFY